MPEANRFIGCNAPDAAVFAKKVVMDEPDLEVLFHFLNVLAGVLFGRALLDDSIGSLDHSVGFGRVRLGFAMLNSPFQTEFLEGMAGFSCGCPSGF